MSVRCLVHSPFHLSCLKLFFRHPPCPVLFLAIFSLVRVLSIFPFSSLCRLNRSLLPYSSHGAGFRMIPCRLVPSGFSNPFKSHHLPSFPHFFFPPLPRSFAYPPTTFACPLAITLPPPNPGPSLPSLVSPPSSLIHYSFYITADINRLRNNWPRSSSRRCSSQWQVKLC